MKLADWLRRTGTTQAQLAEEIGFSEAQVSLWVRGKEGASAEAALAVEKHTRGAVKALSLVRRHKLRRLRPPLNNKDAA